MPDFGKGEEHETSGYLFCALESIAYRLCSIRLICGNRESVRRGICRELCQTKRSCSVRTGARGYRSRGLGREKERYRVLEDKDGNGIADVFDNLGKGAKHTTKTTKNEFSYTIEGDRAAGLEQIMTRMKAKAGTSRTESASMAGKPSAGFVSPLTLEQEREREREQTRRRTARNVVLGIVLGFLAAIVLSRLGYL